MSQTPERLEGRRVVSVYEEFFSGGARILHTDMLIGLQQRGWDNKVITIHDRTFREQTVQFMEQDASYQRLLDAGVEIISLGRHALNGSDTSPFSKDEISIAQEAALGADVVMSLKEHPVRLLNQAQGLGAAAIACLHRSDPENQGPALDELRNAVQGGVIDVVTTCAESSKRAYAQAGIPGNAIKVIRNGIDIERFKPNEQQRHITRTELGIGDEDPVVLLVARYDEMKNIPLFVESAGKYLQDDPRAHVIMCGGGMRVDNEALMQTMRVAYANDESFSRTHLLGIRRDMENVYPAADVVALTSKFGEAYPLCLLEGMACGAVPVATRVGDTADILRGRGIVTGFDSDEIVTAWHSAIRNRDAYALSDSERRWFDRATMIGQYEKVIQRTILNTGKGGQIAV